MGPPEPPQRTAARNFALTIAATAALLVLGVVSGALSARLLGVDGRGVLAAGLLWPYLIAYVGDLGGPVAYTYIVSTTPDLRSRLVNNAFHIVVYQSVGLALIGVPLVLFALRKYNGLGWMSAGFLVVYLPVSLMLRYLMSIHQGAGEFIHFNSIRVAVQATTLAGICMLFLGHVVSVGAVMAVTLLGNLVGLAVAARSLVALRTVSRHVDRGLARQTFAYGLRAHFGNLTPVDAVQLDLAFVVALLSARDAGLYVVAVAATMVIRAQGTAIGMVAMPGIAALSDRTTRLVATAATFKLALLFHLATAILLVVAARFLVTRIYGSSFADAAILIRILCVAGVASSLRQVLSDALRGLGQPLAASGMELVTLVVTIAALAALVPTHGVLGAAFAVDFGYVVALGASLGYIHRLGATWASLLVPGRGELALVRGIVKRRGR
jgi:O-antigen/teichoic acid export membrane protein